MLIEVNKSTLKPHLDRIARLIQRVPKTLHFGGRDICWLICGEADNVCRLIYEQIHMAYEGTFTADQMMKGSAGLAFSFSKFKRVIDKLAGPFTISSDDKILVISSEAEGVLYSFPLSDPASITPCAWKNEPQLDGAIRLPLSFRQILKTLPCIEKDPDMRTMITCAEIVKTGDSLDFHATNGHVMARLILRADGLLTVLPDYKLLLPGWVLKLFADLPCCEVLIVCYANASRLMISYEGFSFFTSEVPEGRYPNIDKVSCADNPYSFTCDHAALLRSVRSTLALIPSAYRYSKRIMFTLHGVCEGGSGRLSMEADTDKTDDKLEGWPIPVQQVIIEGDRAFSWAMNVGYMVQILEAMPCENIQITFKEPETGLRLQPYQPADPNKEQYAVIMPLKITE